MKNEIKFVLLLFIGLGSVSNSTCQVADVEPIELLVFDHDTKQPIEGVHAFFVNSTFGAISSPNGIINLTRPIHFKQELVITHIGYETKVLSSKDYLQRAVVDSVFMIAHGFNLDAIIVEGSSDKVWKKRYKRFRKAFLGSEKQSSKCVITNPEVLEFTEEEGSLIAKAKDLINIKNDYLGYDINFHLENFNLSKDESLQYSGQARYSERSEGISKKIEKNRKKAFERSSKNFYLALINDDLESRGLSMSLVRYHGGRFIEFMKPSRAQMIKLDTSSGHYILSFTEFLQVTNKNIKEIVFTEIPGVSSGLESRRFNSPRGSESGRRVPATSQIYKMSESVVLDSFGNVLNPEAVREYGFWAKERMATSLPFDYGWEMRTALDEIKTSDASKVITKKSEETRYLKDLIYGDKERKSAAMKYLIANWALRLFPPLMELHRMTSDEALSKEILSLLQEHGGEENVPNYYDGLKWLWEQEPLYDEDYLDFKAEIYRHVDPSFMRYFSSQNTETRIRPDEVVWGGVKRDGIPPLRSPNMISAKEADYLDPGDVVFAMFINGEAKAYPKRILAWHEFFQDNVGGVEIAGVYCTLCGTMIAYDRKHGDELYDLGTSGFLYRSNKLMYDRATYSLWSTIEGRPVIGPLSERDIVLATHPVITTTWGSWSRRHPETKVLSLNTGYDRNYDEGEAYKDYFESDALMFPVPLQDTRLKNKQEVVVVRVPGYEKDPVALSVDHLKKHEVVNEIINGQKVVILFDELGGARAYRRGNNEFKSFSKENLRDTEGGVWLVKETEIRSAEGERWDRLPSHNIFWFAWLNAYPNTRLVK